ncbi:sensor histidine kinase [Roseateles violae]|uniref:histidine kinase n=1 Tax=Roseateles violae TaxID=3058042 RepID=A0ABT8DVG2_9BURK|nr:ATP-binding protein [Pelomonas sp. PFR6]MDN3922257.1 7TM diverse intracellular signaling domain-containing protein [Pelomonas sp. PFR6]
MAESLRSGWMRSLALVQALLFSGLLLLLQPAGAQMIPLPEQAPRSGGQQATTARLAISQWSADDLKAWWAALRTMDGGPGSFPDHLPPRLQPPDDPAAWRPVSLPDVRTREAGKGLSAEDPQYQMRWYRLRYTPPQGRWSTSVALYMPRLVTMAAAVLVHTEEGWRPVFDNQAGAREQWVRPLWAAFPAALTELRQEQELDVVVAVPVLRDSFYAVSSAWLGAREDLEPQYQRRWALQIGVPQATGLTLVVLGLFSFALWVRRREEPAYLLFALATVAWLVRNLHYHLDLPRTRLGLEWFWWATHASMSWVMLLTFLFALRFARQRHPQFDRAMAIFVIASSLLSMPIWLSWLDTLVLQHAVNAIVGTIGTLFVGAVAVREGSRELRLIALSLLLGLALGVHDLFLLAGWAWPEHIYLMPFATLIIVVSFLYAVQRRYVGALDEVELTNASLAQKLEQQGAQLQAQHDRLREAERQQALLIERQRLMQDMHDGLGSSLLSAMVAVEQGSMDQDKVVEVLRECVDDLRLVIDSLEPVGHDLVSLLATMRYRLGKRLQAGGLVLEWDVQDLPPLEWLEPPDALHVLRLMQEALSNVLKHARATRVRMVTRHHGSYVEIRVEDDGDGFDVGNAPAGRGLKSQQRRAQRLGGHVRIDSSPGHGTRLSLRLPVLRKGPTQQNPG